MWAVGHVAAKQRPSRRVDRQLSHTQTPSFLLAMLVGRKWQQAVLCTMKNDRPMNAVSTGLGNFGTV